MTASASTAHRLEPGSFDHFYRGGERLHALRRIARGAHPAPLQRPEEWLGSTVTRWGTDGVGLSVLDGGALVRDLVAADPLGWLGSDHVAEWGDSPALLVKLLDAGQRLPVHVHPDRAFAARHLDCPFGKTEAWVIIDAPAPGGSVFVGATRPVGTEEWAELVAAQDTDAMLGLLHELTVRTGDAVLVPAGTPHAIDAGVFVVELQEPTDFSILLEWDGFDIDGRRDGHLGLGFETALAAVRTDAIDHAGVDALVKRAQTAPHSAALPAAADAFFRAWRVDNPSAPVALPTAFSVVVVVDGDGALRDRSGERPVSRGDVYLVPYAAGPVLLEGRLAAIVAQPPDPLTAHPPDPLAAHPPDPVAADPPDPVAAHPPDPGAGR